MKPKARFVRSVIGAALRFEAFHTVSLPWTGARPRKRAAGRGRPPGPASQQARTA